MSKIKSAIELAMERTAEVSIDKEAVRKDQIIRSGRTAAGRFLSEPSSVSLPDELESVKREERDWMKEGMVETLLANITLPRYESDLNRYIIVANGLKDLGGKRGPNARSLEHILDQYQDLFRQYLESVDKLEEQLRARWEPRLRQKEQQIRQQTGQAVRLTPERDPEFAKVLSDEIARIDAQYSEVINQGKDELRKMV